MVDGVKGVDRAVLIRTSMGASRRSVKKRQVLSQSLAVHPSILSAARARVGVIGRSHPRSIDSGVLGPKRAASDHGWKTACQRQAEGKETTLLICTSLRDTQNREPTRRRTIQVTGSAGRRTYLTSFCTTQVSRQSGRIPLPTMVIRCAGCGCGSRRQFRRSPAAWAEDRLFIAQLLEEAQRFVPVRTRKR